MDKEHVIILWCLEHGIAIEEGIEHRAMIEDSYSYHVLLVAVAFADLRAALAKATRGIWAFKAISRLFRALGYPDLPPGCKEECP